MSMTELPPPPPSSSKLFHKPYHQRKNSDELDVFEAANYFSGYYNEVPSNNRVIARGASVRRMSLDNGMMIQTHQIMKKENNNSGVTSGNLKQSKQPSSPGGRLASFLNQLFHHGGTAGVGSNKKKKKSKSTTKDEDEFNGGEGGRRKRRSSISNITRSWYYSTSTTTSTSTTSAHLPPKANKSHFNQKAVSPLPIKSGALVDEKVAKSVNGCDGYESDSSSDLFELQNYDSDVYSNGGLPVYDTTSVCSISASTM
ncbi:Protein BIG GRAIN 1-like E [Linum perenne]